MAEGANPEVEVPTRWDVVIELIMEIGATRIAEIGVRAGETTQQVLGASLGLELYLLVDHKPHGGFDRWLSKRTFDSVNYLKMSSLAAADLTPDESLDLVFIDATHKYAWVKQDIELWLPKVRGCGILCGHDYANPPYPGVTKAVDEAFGNRKRVIGCKSGGSIWVVKREGVEEHYAE